MPDGGLVVASGRGWSRHVAGVALLASLVGSGCTGSPGRERSEATVTTTRSTTTTSIWSTAATTSSTASGRSTSATTSSTASGGSSSATTSSTASGGSSSASTVRTDGGDVTVRARGGRLEVVEIRPAAGWSGEHRAEGGARLVVTFARDGGRVDVLVELTASGIATQVRSESTG